MSIAKSLRANEDELVHDWVRANLIISGGRFAWGVSSGRAKVGKHLKAEAFIMMPPTRRKVSALRLAWLIYHGEWPKGTVEAINGRIYPLSRGNLRLREKPVEEKVPSEYSIERHMGKVVRQILIEAKAIPAQRKYHHANPIEEPDAEPDRGKVMERIVRSAVASPDYNGFSPA